MNILDFYKTNYKVNFLRILRQYWKDDKRWSCIGAPKADHMFLYLDGCSTVYTLKDGTKITANSGDTLFVPKGLEYVAEFYDFQSEKASTVNINFTLYNSDGNAADGFNEITHFSSSDVRLSVNALEQLSLSLQPIPTKLDVEIYKIFNIMGDETAKEKRISDSFEIVRNGVEYLHYHYNEDISVGELAKKCNVSEVYFRQLFKKHMRYSPAEYKQILRLEHACRYLKHSESSVSEIAEVVGYDDTAYFIKIFKKHFGITPLNYRKQSL